MVINTHNNKRIVELIIFYVVHVVSKESRQFFTEILVIVSLTRFCPDRSSLGDASEIYK
jgi:hypothetical protein